MIQIDKILFPTDFSRCAGQALDHALFLAEKFQAELHLLHVHVLHADDPADPEHHFPEAEELFRRLHAIAGSELARLLDRGAARALRLREFQPRGIAAAPLILEHIDEHGIGLVVMGTHGRRGPIRFFFGSVVAETVHSARCPILTLRELDQERPIEAIDRILVPIDFSGASSPQIRYAARLAEVYDARLQLLHVIENPVHPHFYTTLDGERAARGVTALEGKTQQALHEAVNAAGGGDGVEYDVVVRRGRAATEIVDFAAAESDMIVIAKQGLSGIERLLLGSTAQEVVRSADTPVFLTRPWRDSR